MRRLSPALLVAAALACSWVPRTSPPAPRPQASAQGEQSAPAPSVPAAESKGPPPADLPPPLPPPTGTSASDVPAPLGTEPADPLELLWSHRLELAGGSPIVTIRIMEGQEEIAFRARGRAVVHPRGAAAIAVEAGATLHVRARSALPAALARYPLLAQLEFQDRAGLEAARRRWEERGVKVHPRTLGGVYGIAGRVIDNRRILLLGEAEASDAAGDGASGRHGERPAAVFTDLLTRPSGTLQLSDDAGRVLAEGDTAVAVEVEGGAGFLLARVEHDAGSSSHGFEDRGYRGRLYVTVDAAGKLAAVHGVALEELLRGLVPSEMPAGSPLEALKAQAVTARSNVLAQIGTRHLTDPYMLCSEVHCQAYRGESAHAASTDAAVRATAGEALFGREDRVLVDAVYSAMCGGHGEDNDAVWGNIPSPSLRGHPDLPPDGGARWKGGLSDEARLRAFLAASPEAYCKRARAAPVDRYRWERRFSAAELTALAAPFGLGHVSGLRVTSRGVSGRARSLRLEGATGSAAIAGELRIRRFLRNLPSAMFVVEPGDDGVVLRGGGWGHGAGMCQWGAVGRAEARQDYREILRAYFSGAEVATVY